MFYVGGDNLNATYSFANTTPSMKIFTNSVDIDKIISPFQYDDLVINFKSKISGDLISNPNISKISWKSSNVAYSTVLNPIDFTTELLQAEYDKINYVDKQLYSIKAPNRSGIPQEIFIFDVITSFESAYGKIEGENMIDNKLLWLKNNIDTITITFNGYGFYNGGNAAYLDVFSCDIMDWYYIHNGNKTSLMNAANTSTDITLTCNKDSNISIAPWNLIDDNGIIKIIAYTEPTTSTSSSKVSTLNTNYIELKFSFKTQNKLTPSWKQIVEDASLTKIKTQNQENITNIDYINKTAKCGNTNLVLQNDVIHIGYDTLAPSNPTRDINGKIIDTCVLIEKNINSITSDYSNKIRGSVTENPNIIKTYSGTKLYDFSTNLSELSQTEYDKIKINSDGKISTYSTSSSKYMPQILYQFDIVKIYEKQYGTLNANNKISVLKSIIKNLNINWYGYATNYSGYKIYLCYWANGGDTPNSWVGGNLGWTNYTNNTKSLSSINTDNNPINLDNVPIDSNGILNILVYTDPVNGTSSKIMTDYISLTINFRDRQDNAVLYLGTNSLNTETIEDNKVSTYLLETDFTDLCNSNFQGDSSLFLNSLNNIELDVWTSAFGINNNRLSNGVNYYLYDFYLNKWITNGLNGTLYKTSTGINTNKLIINPSNNLDRYIDANNKVYTLITSKNPSLYEAPSRCNLDFAQVKVNYSSLSYKIPDIQNINLTSNWSLFIKGFCPNWNSNTTKENRCIFSVTSGSMIIKLYFDSVNKKWILGRYNPTKLKWDFLISNSQSFSQYQMHNFLIEQISTGIRMRILKNGGSIEKYTFTDEYVPSGLGYFYTMTDENLSNRADGYVDRFFYMKDTNYKDDVAELLLRGNLDKFEYVELYDSSKSYIPVMPNNRYLVSGVTNTGTMNIVYLNNEIIIKTDNNVLSSIINSRTIQIPSNCNRVSFDTTETFKDVSFKLIM